MRPEKRKRSYKHPTQARRADNVWTITMPRALIMGNMPVTANDIMSDLNPLLQRVCISAQGIGMSETTHAVAAIDSALRS